MTQVVLIGIGAGATAALLFASVTGAGLSVILFYFAPLPIMIVALGWSHWAALVAAVVAAAMLGAAVIVSALATFGADQATIRSGLKGALEQVLRLQTDVAEDSPLRFPGIRDTDGVIDMLAA